MSESKKIEELKEKSLKLFELKDNFQEYEEKAIEIADEVHDFKLEHIIDSGELRFFLINPVRGKDLSVISNDEFCKSLEDYFKPKKIDYYFQLTELADFPKGYRLGFGVLLTFDLLPKQVRTCAENLSKGKVPSVAPSTQKVWNQIIRTLTIPADPKLGTG